MSIARYAVAEAPVAEGEQPAARKTPTKRQTVALADARVVPEPR